MRIPQAFLILVSSLFAADGPCSLFAADQPPLWVEAESYQSQTGASAPFRTVQAASNGACLSDGWGGKAGHLATYVVELPQAMASPHLYLRYAREMSGDAVLHLDIDGAGLASDLRLPSTGDWGFKAQGWRYVNAVLPDLKDGKHRLTFSVVADGDNVNLDGFYLSPRPLDTDHALADVLPPRGPVDIAAIGADLKALPCKTPLALPFSLLKAYVDGGGEIQSFRDTPVFRKPGPAFPPVPPVGPRLRVALLDHGPWRTVVQRFQHEPIPSIVTRHTWDGVDIEQTAYAAAPEERGFVIHVSVTNTSQQDAVFTLASLIMPSGSDRGKILRVLASGQATTTAMDSIPGPLGGGGGLRHILKLRAGTSGSFVLQFMGSDGTRTEIDDATALLWRKRLEPAARLHLPDPRLQYAADASLRQMLSMIQPWPQHARILKGLENYYGANPYDTLQASRSLDDVGLKNEARELLRHQIEHLKHDGLFEMWENGILEQKDTDQWIVQGLAASALWSHWLRWRDQAWLREIQPVLATAANKVLTMRREHTGQHRQGAVDTSGLMPPCVGDGGLPVGYHWTQNTGPLACVRIAAEAARLLGSPEADELGKGYREYRDALDRVRQQAVTAAGGQMIPSFPGASGNEIKRPLWGVVMSVTTFSAFPATDPMAVGTLRFLQSDRRWNLHRNLGYSGGIWPYLSAEVALWHLELSEAEEAWRIQQAIVARASSTACWYEEIDEQRGHCDPADMWSAAEMVHLSRELLARTSGDELYLAQGLPVEFMQAGRSVGVDNLPTAWGPLTYRIRFDAKNTTADIRFSGERRPTSLRICLSPESRQDWGTISVQGAAQHVRRGRDLAITANSNHVTVTISTSDGGR